MKYNSRVKYTLTRAFNAAVRAKTLLLRRKRKYEFVRVAKLPLRRRRRRGENRRRVFVCILAVNF